MSTPAATQDNEPRPSVNAERDERRGSPDRRDHEAQPAAPARAKHGRFDDLFD